MNSIEAWLNKAEDLIHNLYMPSETDAPITIWYWPDSLHNQKPTIVTLLQTLSLPADSTVEMISVPNFFAAYSDSKETFDAEETMQAERFCVLAQFLETSLKDTQVYCFGTVDIDVLIVGQHDSGQWIGLRTKLVET